MSKFNVAEDATLLDAAAALDGTELIEIEQDGAGKKIVMAQIAQLSLTPVNGIASAALLTSSGEGVPATHAVNVLTSDATNVTALDTVTIGSTVYRFMTTTVLAYDVLIGASAAATLDNLKAAINATGTGDGTDYHAGTLVHPDVVATTNADTTQEIQAKVVGTVPNAIVTTEASTHLSFADTTLGGGTGASVAGVTTAAALLTIGTRVYTFVDELSETKADAVADQILYGVNAAAAIANMKVALNAGLTVGTNYSTGTVVNALVVGGASDAVTIVVTADVKGVAGDLIASVCALANFAFDDALLGTAVAGVDGTVGLKGQFAFDATNIYVCKIDSGITDTGNWRKVAHSAI